MPSKFTVAVPTHNRRETAVLAVRSALAQTRPPEQVIVLCDGCTDGTAEAVRALDESVEIVELAKQPGFAYGHRNEALKRARGEVITWLADDDLYLPDHLERIGEYWDAGVVDIVGAATVIVDKHDTPIWYAMDWSLPECRAVMAKYNTNVMTSVSVSVGLAREAGGWDPTQPRAGDWDLWKRALEAGARAAMTAEPTVLHFRATGRGQAWSLRVRQNRDWFERTQEPVRLAEMRRELRRVRSRHELSLLSRVSELEARLAVQGAEAERREAEHAQLQATTADLSQQVVRIQTETERLQEVERTLGRVYAGGWWRLRRRLRPLLWLVGRGR